MGEIIKMIEESAVQYNNPRQSHFTIDRFDGQKRLVTVFSVELRSHDEERRHVS